MWSRHYEYIDSISGSGTLHFLEKKMAESVLSMVGERVGELLISEAKFLYGVHDQVEELRKEIRQMQSFLRQVDEDDENEMIHTLVVEIRDVAYDAEDVLETFFFKVATRGRRPGGIGNFLIRICCRLNEGIALHKAGLEIENIKSKISKLITSLQTYSIRSGVPEGEELSSRQERQRQLRYSYSHLVEEDFVGFDQDVKMLVDNLVDERKYCRVVSVCGMGGLGKTTIARKVYNHSDVRCHFDRFSWVCISQQCQRRNILQRIFTDLISAGGAETLADDDLVRRLYEVQQEQKCLVILDDIWFEETWGSLKPAFPVGIKNTSSKILLTTRKAEVARHVDPDGLLHELRFLSDEESWDLLQKKAFPRQKGSRVDIELEKKGREMVRQCGGLPLAIIVLGGVLANRHTLMEWEMVHQAMDVFLRKGTCIGQQDLTVQDVLALSYNDLPYPLKPCFLYLANFPEDYSINAETLYLLWMAESFILLDDQGEGETLMDVAERYLWELAQRNVVKVQLINDDSWVSTYRRFQSCSLHDLMWDLCLSKGKYEDFLKVLDFNPHKNESSSSAASRTTKIRRLSVFFNNDSDNDGPTGICSIQQETALGLRSLFLLNPNGWRQGLLRWPLEMPKLEEFKYLRVLLLDGLELIPSNKKLHLKGIGKLIHLRYLGLKYCQLEELPSSIGNLRFLQTIDLYLFNEIKMPNVMWKLQQLRHLYLPGKFFVKDGQKLRLDGLTMLETLQNFDPNMCKVEDLLHLPGIRNFKVRLTTNLEGILNYLNRASSRLRESNLILKTYDYCSEERLSFSERVLGCQGLNFLLLEGHIDYPLEYDFHHFSPSLTRIKLSMSEFEEDPMAMLEKLPNLRNLILYMNAYVGQEMVCSALGFRQLRKLVLGFMTNLKRWRIEEGAMPNLHFLEINHCWSLEMIPDGLRFLTNLQRLTFQDMPEAFKDRVRVIDGKEGEDYDKVRHVPLISLPNVMSSESL